MHELASEQEKENLDAAAWTLKLEARDIRMWTLAKAP